MLAKLKVLSMEKFLIFPVTKRSFVNIKIYNFEDFLNRKNKFLQVIKWLKQ